MRVTKGVPQEQHPMGVHLYKLSDKPLFKVAEPTRWEGRHRVLVCQVCKADVKDQSFARVNHGRKHVREGTAVEGGIHSVNFMLYPADAAIIKKQLEISRQSERHKEGMRLRELEMDVETKERELLAELRQNIAVPLGSMPPSLLQPIEQARRALLNADKAWKDAQGGGKVRRVLTDKLRMILLEGPKQSGSYNPPDALGAFEEQMTLDEIDLASEFLNWIIENKLKYGHGTLDDRWAEWQA